MSDVICTNRGFLTKAQMVEMLRPGALDASQVVGRRIRWAYVTPRSDEQDTRRVSDQLKERHYELGAFEVLVHHGPWAAEPTEG